MEVGVSQPVGFRWFRQAGGGGVQSRQLPELLPRASKWMNCPANFGCAIEENGRSSTIACQGATCLRGENSHDIHSRIQDLYA